MLPTDKLRLRNSYTFEDESSFGKRDRPLEWRRSFNTVTYIAKSPNVECLYSVNEIDYLEEPKDTEDSDGKIIVVTPQINRNLVIGAQVSQDEVRDTIYCTEETERNSGLYALSRPRGDVRIVLTDKPPTEARGPFGAGAYAGLVFRADFEPDEDYLCIDASIPSSHLHEIAFELKQNPQLELHVIVAIQSFSYEVDDALCEWYHRRDFFIHGNAAPAAIVSVRTKQPTPKITSEALDEDDRLPDAEDVPFEDDPNTQVSSIPSTIQIDQLSGIKVALWAIAILLAVNLLK